MTDLAYIALHEAGHAVVAWANGVLVEEVYATETAGHCDCAEVRVLSPIMRPLVAWGGILAGPGEGCGSDDEVARDRPDLEAVVRKQLTEHWPAVLAVRDALVERGILDTEALAALLGTPS